VGAILHAKLAGFVLQRRLGWPIADKQDP